MKHLVTVQWSYSVEVDIPEGIDPNSLIECDWNAPDDVQALAAAATKDASFNINWKDGVITDVQDAMPDTYGELFGIGDTVNAKPKGGDFEHEFTGTVISKERGFIQVKDQDGEVFDCDSDQLSFNTDLIMHD